MMKKCNITKKAALSTLIVFAGIMLVGIPAYADGTGRRNHIKSRGIIDYAGGEVVLDSSDLIYLADEVDVLERTYKRFVLEYLNGISTYLDSEGNVTHDWEENDNEYYPSFSQLLTGIDLSQEVTTGTTVDNLSKDMGAWVNGEYISGNGNDVNEAYLKGLQEGFDNALEHCTISYVYHEHTGSPNAAGGCYSQRRTNCGGSLRLTHISSPYPCNDPGHSEGHMHRDYTTQCKNCGKTYVNYGNSAMEYGNNGENAEVGYTLRYTFCVNNLDYIVLSCGKTESTIESATIVFTD